MLIRRDRMDLVKELRQSLKSSFPDTAQIMSDQQKGLTPRSSKTVGRSQRASSCLLTIRCG